MITTYMGKIVKLKSAHINSISHINKMFIMQFMKFFEGELEGVQVKIKNNIYYISPHMERFDELKNKLEEIVLQNKVNNE